MNRCFLLVGIYFFLCRSLQAQDSSYSVPRLQLTDFSILFGGSSHEKIYSSLEDFQHLAPGSLLLKNDFSGFSEGDGYRSSKKNYNDGEGFAGFYTAVRFANRKKGTTRQNFLLRIGAMYLSGLNLDYNLYSYESSPYDTLISSQNGNVTYIDSVFTENYTMEYTSDQVRVDLSLLFYLKATSRFSLYSGVGGNVGWIFNTATTIDYFSDSYTSERGYPYYHSYGSNDRFNADGERYINKNGMGYSVYVPFGVDLRLARYQFFWRHVHVFSEFRFGVNSFSVPELPTYTKPNFVASFGLRYTSF